MAPGSSTTLARGWRGSRWAIAPAAGLAVALSPLPLEPRAHTLAAIFVMAVLLWVSEAVPLAVTSLTIPAALTVFGVSRAGESFAGFGHPILFIFVGGFFLAESMKRHGLDRRIASWIVGRPFIAGRPRATLAAFGATGLLLSMWISNTAAAAILLPIFLRCAAPRGEEPHPGAESGVLSIAYIASIGGMGTLVGSPPNGITAAFLEEALGPGRFGFLEWTLVGLPTSIAVGAVILGYFWFVEKNQLAFEAPRHEAGASLSRGEVVTLVCFSLALVGWSAPGVLKLTGSAHAAWAATRLHSGAVALLAALPLFVVRDELGERVLPWRDAARIDWGIIMLFAGGIALGEATIATGLSDAVGRAFVEGTGVRDLWILTAFALAFTVFFTEVCSNTAAASILVPLAVSAARAIDVNPIPPALAVGLGASCAFMLPIATGPNAIAYSTGAIRPTRMARHGFALNILVIVAGFGVLRALCPVLGFDR